MSLIKKKMLLAPILAIALAFLLAGSVSFLPQNASHGQPIPQPTSVPNSTMPPLPTTAPVSQGTSLSGISPVVFAVAAVIVGIVAALLFFSEKKLNKEIET